MSQSHKEKVLIVGAGAAGLACARELNKSGINFKIIEARNRIGGRAWSTIENQNIVEYGAEFIHGAHPEIISLLDRTHHSFIDVSDHHLFFRNNNLRKEMNFWSEVEKINSLLNLKIKKDRSIADFLYASEDRIDNELKKLYVSYVEGFQAADPKLIGEKSLAEAELTEEPELNGQTQFRPGIGYSAVMDCLYKEASLKKSQILFSTVVQKVTWSQGRVNLIIKDLKTKRISKVSGSHIVITVPVEVLKNLTITPKIPSLQKSLETLYMGHAQRITFQFSSQFWSEISKESVAFLHAGSQMFFPTWWTQMPIRNSLITAWQGGPKAYEMSSWSEADRVDVALKTLSALTQKSLAYLKKHCLAHFTHNWTRDPFSLGAYSYTGLQNESRRSRLAKPFHDTIYIAGEATAPGSGQGTVHGAMQSGVRSANQITKLILSE